MALLKRLQARQQPADREGADNAEKQQFAHLPGLDAVKRRCHLVEGTGHRRQQGFAFRSYLQAARETLKKRDAQPLFQSLDLLAHSGLRHA